MVWKELCKQVWWCFFGSSTLSLVRAVRWSPVQGDIFQNTLTKTRKNLTHRQVYEPSDGRCGKTRWKSDLTAVCWVCPSSITGSPHLLYSLPTSVFVSARAVLWIVSLVPKESVFQPKSNQNPKGIFFFCISSSNPLFIPNVPRRYCDVTPVDKDIPHT